MIKALIALVMILTIASPILLYFIWTFVAPGMYKHKWRIIILFMPMSIGCFFVGASLSYFIVTPLLINFSKGFIPRSIIPLITVGDFTEILLIFTILGGLFFLLPFISFMYAKIGIMHHTWIAKYRKYAIIVIFVIAAFLTPPDPVSQIIIALPLILLYEMSILAARFAEKNTLI